METTTVVDRVLIPQEGESTSLTGGKLGLAVALGFAPTGIGTLIAGYFIFMGFIAWLGVRNKPGYVPFRIGWKLLVFLFVATPALGVLLVSTVMLEPTADDQTFAVIFGAVWGVGLWLALVALRFAFHLVDCRHLNGKQRHVATAEVAVAPVNDCARFTNASSAYWMAKAKE